jgi:hypothetical protein
MKVQSPENGTISLLQWDRETMEMPNRCVYAREEMGMMI